MSPVDDGDGPGGPGGRSDRGVRVERPEFVPDPLSSRAEMEALQRDLAADATFADDHGLTPEDVAIGTAFDLSDGLPAATAAADQDGPVVVGVDQAFRPDDGEAISAAVAIRDGEVVEYASAITPLSIPYVPGLLAFREGGPILAALEALSVPPDLLVFDGSGRIHFREAGIATHVGVTCDLPSVGVAKGLLCGDPGDSVDERPAGWRTPIRADGSIETGDGGAHVLGYALQSRQYPNSRRVNPLYVSPGHRVSAATATDLVEALCAGYKLPEPTRLADAYADAVKRDIVGSGR
ncbi:endonuclease V [Halorubrum sp. JWXQ-INN 858]|uniref:endonuclease V n=1 Tax=Halorubrum sp. JWXQ-INN 858 TaxID=2690782 RepID=UPI001358529C|nr:endonuclease V [Halorubrum sp. JWXQ-INN 858]